MAEKTKTILLPGGVGYIGSHTIVDILQNTPHRIVVADDFSNCDHDVLERIMLTIQAELKQGQDIQQFRARVAVHQGNILDFAFLESIFKLNLQESQPINTIIHFAAKKCAPESSVYPLEYYENNFVGSMNLLKLMEKYHDCTEFMFSSTAAVYGDQDNCTEDFQCKPISPYGESKLCVELLLKSMAKRHANWKIISLRYFNPAGNHDKGFIGDWPTGNFPANLFPVMQEVIIGKRSALTVFGNDYNTIDGSGVRDFIHVTDLAHGHLKALARFDAITDKNNYDVFNLGSQNGYSVLQVIKQFEELLGRELKYTFGPRREGDMERLVAVAKKAETVLGWKTQKSLKDMCESCLKFTQTVQQKISDKEKKKE